MSIVTLSMNEILGSLPYFMPMNTPSNFSAVSFLIFLFSEKFSQKSIDIYSKFGYYFLVNIFPTLTHVLLEFLYLLVEGPHMSSKRSNMLTRSPMSRPLRLKHTLPMLIRKGQIHDAS